MHVGYKLFCFISGFFVSAIPDAEELNPHDVKEIYLFVFRAVSSGIISLLVGWLGQRYIRKKHHGEGR